MKKLITYLLVVFVIAACKTTRNVQKESTETHRNEISEQKEVSKGTSEKKTITDIGSLDIDVDIERIEYDTNVTDSDGTHPIKSRTNIKSKANKESSRTEEKVKNDSLQRIDTKNGIESDSVANNKKEYTKVSVANGVNYGLVIGVALFVVLLLIKLFRR